MRKLVLMFALLSPAFAQQTLQQTLDSGARYVQAPAGTIQLSAPLTIKTNGQTVDFSASVLQCNFDADCIIVGDPSNYNATSNVTLLNPKGAPTVWGTHSFITVYGQKTRIINVSSANLKPGSAFGHLVTVVGDQAFLLDGLDTTAGGFNVRCDPTFCGSWVYAPGPFSGTGGWGTGHNDNAAVGWLTHMQLSMQCQGNGVDWLSGNTLNIRDSVIQGYAQFGVRTGTRRGGYGGTELDNVYMEGGCPAGDLGQAGVIVQGNTLAIHGSQPPRGLNPTFSSTGGTEWLYYVAVNNQTGLYNNNGAPWNLDSVPLFLGFANTDGVTPITGHFPNINGAAIYRVLRTSRGYKPGVGWLSLYDSKPQGTGNWLVATVLASSCTQTTIALNPDGTAVIMGGECSFTDSMTAPLSYTTENPTQPNRDATYHPDIWFWPGDLILVNATLNASDPAANYYNFSSTWRPGN